MFVILTSSLNSNELNILKVLLNKAQILPYSIFQIEKETTFDKMPTGEELSGSNIVLVYDKTKGKPVFMKRLETLYGNDFSEKYTVKATLNKPSTFMKDKQLSEDVWLQIRQLRSLVNHKEVNFDKIDETSLKIISELLNSNEENKSFKFKLDNDMLEIRPNNAEATAVSSLTYQEFGIMYYASRIFNFTKVDIFSDRA